MKVIVRCMKSPDIAKLRLLNQWLVRTPTDSPREIVEWMGMVQAQDLEMALWAVGCRMGRPSRKAVVEAIDCGEIVRMHLARHTWQMVVAEDARDLVELYHERNAIGIQGWAKQNGYEISRQQILESEGLLGQVLKGNEGLTLAELVPYYKSIGIEDQQLVRYLILLAEVNGVICNGVIKGRHHTYALFDERVPGAALLPKKETLARLADRYFRSHAPATLEDFVWWSGLTKGECRMAMGTIAGKLTEVGGYFVHNENRSGRMPNDFAAFLPPYDELLIGYKSREHTIAPELRHHAYNNFGVFRPIILNGRQITGNWNRQNLTATFFSEPISDAAVEKARRRYEEFLSRYKEALKK